MEENKSVKTLSENWNQLDGDFKKWESRKTVIFLFAFKGTNLFLMERNCRNCYHPFLINPSVLIVLSLRGIFEFFLEFLSIKKGLVPLNANTNIITVFPWLSFLEISSQSLNQFRFSERAFIFIHSLKIMYIIMQVKNMTDLR